MLIEHGQVAVLVDPWLGDHPDRAVPAPVITHWPDTIDLVLITHGHGDHLDFAGLKGLATRTRIGEIAAPEPHLRAIAESLPDIPVLGARPERTLPRLGGLHVIPAWHGVTIADGYGPMIGADGTSPHVGYAFRMGGVPIYISGDTIADPSLVAKVKALEPEIVLLPVNGRDAEREARGILGNMDGKEAVDVAVAVGAKALIPLHYDGVVGNLSDVAMVVSAARDRRVDVLVPQRTIPFDVIGKQR